MAEIGRWKGHKFEVSPNLIRGFTGLTVKGSSETEDLTYQGRQYTSLKNGKPTEISMTIHLNALLGCDVRAEAMKFVDEAQSGAKDFFYIGTEKLIICQVMLTEASVEEVQIASNGKWVWANVKLTLKQAADYNYYTKNGDQEKTSTKTSGLKLTDTTKKGGVLTQVEPDYITKTVQAVENAKSVSAAGKAASSGKTLKSQNCVITNTKITRIGDAAQTKITPINPIR